MAEPQDMTLRMLIEMRDQIREGFEKNDARFERLENKIESIRKAAFGESVLGRYAAGEVEERLENLEVRMAAIENSQR